MNLFLHNVKLGLINVLRCKKIAHKPVFPEANAYIKRCNFPFIPPFYSKYERGQDIIYRFFCTEYCTDQIVVGLRCTKFCN